MKLISMAVAILLLASFTAAKPSVEVVQAEPSSQKARVTVLQDGKAAKNLKIMVSGQDGKTQLELSTDETGGVTLPTLHRGTYCLSAAATPILRAELCLDIKKQREHKSSSFVMTLEVKPPLPPTYLDSMDEVEKANSPESVKELRGILLDPSGAGISNVNVEVYAKGSRNKGRALKLKTDQTGRFSRSLAPGVYTVLFEAAGFHTKAVLLEISPEAQPKELSVVLRLGDVS